MATHGAAASYYSGGQSQAEGPPQAYLEDQSKNQHATPSYSHSLQNAETLPPHSEGKQTFAQAFKIDRPKYNDLWAGILVCMPRFLNHRGNHKMTMLQLAHFDISGLCRSLWAFTSGLFV